MLFFISQSLLMGALFFINYTKELQTLDEKIFSDMRLCSFDLECKEYMIDFVSKKDQELYKLYKKEDTLSSYFSIPGSDKNYLKISLPKKSYQQKVLTLRHHYIILYLFVLIITAILSALFAIYTLSPLRNALHLTEEFIKDILHDFNTPLTTLRLNLSILQKQLKENKNITRAQNSIETLLNLQSNLRTYLHTHATQKEEFYLDTLIKERIDLLASTYKHINIKTNLEHTLLHCNKDAFIRIFDNLLTNALKYNKKDGTVSIRLEKNILIIKDSGKGIKNPKKIFDRFYKEQDRGIGIGLHIVKKLCEELGIGISVESKVEKGTKFSLDLEPLIHITQPTNARFGFNCVLDGRIMEIRL